VATEVMVLLARPHPSIAAGLILSSLLIGCSQLCSSASAIGKYRMIASGHTYELSLAVDGAGTLSRDGMVQNIKWDWANEQVFLDLKGGLAVDLEMLSAPPASRQTEAVYLGLIPKCRSGRAIELDLRFEEPEPHFARTD
jgi:hypothetical protein